MPRSDRSAHSFGKRHRLHRAPEPARHDQRPRRQPPLDGRPIVSSLEPVGKAQPQHEVRLVDGSERLEARALRAAWRMAPRSTWAVRSISPGCASQSRRFGAVGPVRHQGSVRMGAHMRRRGLEAVIEQQQEPAVERRRGIADPVHSLEGDLQHDRPPRGVAVRPAPGWTAGLPPPPARRRARRPQSRAIRPSSS